MQSFFLESDRLDPHANLALEETVLRSLEAGELALYLWRNEHSVVIGRNQNPWRECRVAELESNGGRLARRLSGGGAVYHDVGNLNFTFAAAKDVYDIARQMSVVTRALAAFGIDATLTGRNDIEVNGAKVSGNAFFRTPDVQLHHGTLMVSVDGAALARYLSPDPRKLKAKGVASVRSRVANLAELAPGISVGALAEALQGAFAREYGTPAPFPAKRLNASKIERRRARFASAAWLFGDEELSPSLTFGARFSWGSADFELAVEGETIQEARVWSDALDADWIEGLEEALVGCRNEGKAIAERIAGLPAATPEREQMRADCLALIQKSM